MPRLDIAKHGARKCARCGLRLVCVCSVLAMAPTLGAEPVTGTGSRIRRSYGSVVEAPLVSGGLPHVLTPGSLKRSLLRVRLGSAFASRSFRPIEMSSQRRMRGAVHAVAQNEAHSNCHRRRQEQAPVGFQHGPAPTAHSGLWPKKGVRGEGLVRLEVDERTGAGPIAPLIDCQASSPSVPRRSALRH